MGVFVVLLVPANVKVCKKGPYNDRMVSATAFSLLTVIYKAKLIHHRLEPTLRPIWPPPLPCLLSMRQV